MIEQARLVSPRRFLDWMPGDVDHYSARNKEWVNDINFDILARTFATSLVNGASTALNISQPTPMKVNGFRTTSLSSPTEQQYHMVGNTGMHLSGNTGNVQSFEYVNGKKVGRYTPKRYVRLTPEGYHPNGIQMYVEAYMPGSTQDCGGRDPSDEMYGDHGFPVGEDCMGIFVGLSAIMYPPKWHPKSDISDNLMVWAMQHSDYEFAEVQEDFEDIESLLDGIDEDFLGFGLPPVFLRNQRFQRVRFRLPDQPLDADDWSASGLEEACARLAEHFVPMLDDIGKR